MIIKEVLKVELTHYLKQVRKFHLNVKFKSKTLKAKQNVEITYTS